MIKADLHIHTLSTPWDEPFEFDLEQLRQHVVENRLDAIAITNHNTFDKEQYDAIARELSGCCTVYPGVEISALNAHILVIVDSSNAAQLEIACSEICNVLGNDTRAFLSFDQLTEMFPFLDESIVIPHYSKDPAISNENLKKLEGCVSAIEVSSLAKAIRFNKMRTQVYPAVFFTDYRFGCESTDGTRKRYRPGGIYLRAASAAFPSVKAAFNFDDVLLSSSGDSDFEFAPGISVVNGLNLILGKRSTGKTFTLDRIESLCDEGDAYYIRQGELVDSSREDSFYKDLDNRFSNVVHAYLAPWEPILEEAIRRGTKATRKDVVRHYLDALKKHAETSTLSDNYSKCRLFYAGQIVLPSVGDTKVLIDATMTLLSSGQHAALIDEVVGRDRLIILLKRLVGEARAAERIRLAVQETNHIAKSVQQKLNVSSVELKPDPILDSVFENEAFFRKAVSLLDVCWREKRVCDDGGDTFSKYSVIATRKRYTKAQDVKTALGINVPLSGITNLNAGEYIDKLLSLNVPVSLAPALFDVEIGVRDEKDAQPSGGQRTECVFLGRLAEASGSKYVLIDEPESSFDNPFLNEVISTKIRELSRNATVVVATHNQVLGLALRPIKLLFTMYDQNTKSYGIAFGGLREETLRLETGSEGPNVHASVLEILEAGRDSYDQRRDYYEEGGQQ